MNYKEYIDLGFKRTDQHDSICFKESGYYGFFLYYNLNKKTSIEVDWSELNKPKLYVKKPNSIQFYISEITDEQIKQLLKKL